MTSALWDKADLSNAGSRVRFHVRQLAAMVAVAFPKPPGCNDDGGTSRRPAAIKLRKAELARGPFSGFVM